MNKLKKYKLIIILNIFLFNITIYPFLQPRDNEDTIGKKVSITGNIEQLKFFFNALENSDSEKIRIAHYGDSIIWGDIITDNLRVYFQKEYGGHGIGFLSICTDDISARNTIDHEFSDDWEWASVFTKNRGRFPIGIAGTVSKASSNSNLVYKSKNVSPATDSFSEFSIFYSNTNSNSSIDYKVNNQNSENVKLLNGGTLNSTKLEFNSVIKDIEFDFKQCEGAYFYGVTLESGNGVYVDNFPFRGNSGVSLRDLDDELLPVFSEKLNYKLIVLQFGVNFAASGNVKYKWYERMMLRSIEKLQKNFPETSILIISPGDFGQKKGKKMVTHPEIKKFVSIQEDIAIKGKVAFWNMFEAMGGENSISSWVNALPPLAFKDYCHLTWDGGEIISQKLITSLKDAKSKLK